MNNDTWLCGWICGIIYWMLFIILFHFHNTCTYYTNKYIETKQVFVYSPEYKAQIERDFINSCK